MIENLSDNLELRINIEPHTRVRMEENRVVDEEIILTLRNGKPFDAKNGRLGRSKVFPFNALNRGRFHPHEN